MTPREAPTVHIVGLALIFLAPGMLFAAAIEWASPTSHDEIALVLAALVSAGIGAAMRFTTSAGTDVSAASVFSIVAWSWIASSVVGALPYVFGSMFTWSQWDGALFEAASGFSCTGSTVLADIERNGRGILMWRQLTQWYGGMGVVVLAVSVLPYLGVGGLALMTAEAPGPASDRLAPRVSDTARRLWVLYAQTTLAVLIALWVLPGVDLYDATAHAFSTTATGGFSTYNASIGHFDSLAVELVLVVAMLYCGISFALHYRFLRGERRVYLRSADTLLYGAITAGAFLLATVILLDEGAAFGHSLRDVAFTVATLGSSTGFGNVTGPDSIADFAAWPPAAQIVALALMVVGGCTGSTAGGLKTFRVYVGAKHVVREIRKLEHPRGVFPLKLGPDVVPEAIVASVLGLIGLFFGFALAGTVILAFMGVDLLPAASGAISAMSNMGPALGDAGPTSNFLVYPRPGRLVLAALMLIGRLEISAIVLMFAAALRSYRLRDAGAKKAPNMAAK